MILILSVEKDQITSDVISWLLYNRVNFIRINDNEFFSVNKIELQQNGLTISLANQSKEIEIKDVKAYWYRRGKINLNWDKTRDNGINKALKRELQGIEQIIDITLSNVEKRIGKYSENFLNKINNLSLAQKVGLYIPKTLITSKRNNIKAGLKTNKAITDIVNYKSDESFKFSIGISLFSEENIISSPTTFFPTLFQEYIEKKYELRIFYLHKTFFSMAIFSQSNEKTKIDFRNYDYDKPNRTVPYKLPKKIEIKLLKLMGNLNLTSGSIDMLVDKHNLHYFLEVNPIGQFSQVSIPCNYYLEKEIACFLSK